VRAHGKTGADASSDTYTEDFLYDLENDPHERSNLVADPDYEEVRDMLGEILKERMVEAGEEEPRIMPATANPG
jgi:uncharacterized sulfatase